MISPHDLEEPPHSEIGRVVSFEEDDEVINAAEDGDINGNHSEYSGDGLIVEGEIVQTEPSHPTNEIQRDVKQRQLRIRPECTDLDHSATNAF
mmetsp:Transcript_9251/g.16819  ORF Transcript_9251/g.16819 Transcript_9251/m.16819 type:complete len:93 (+) Transcript_9251:844-1122(+)